MREFSIKDGLILAMFISIVTVTIDMIFDIPSIIVYGCVGTLTALFLIGQKILEMNKYN